MQTPAFQTQDKKCTRCNITLKVQQNFVQTVHLTHDDFLSAEAFQLSFQILLRCPFLDKSVMYHIL